MFLGFGEVVVVLIVALMVLGPKKMPEVARKLAKVVGQVRRLTDEVRSQVDDALREPEPKKEQARHQELNLLSRLAEAHDPSHGHEHSHEPGVAYDALGHKRPEHEAPTKPEAGPVDE